MKLEKAYDHLIEALEDCISRTSPIGKKIALQAAAFFEELKEAFLEASPAEQKQLKQMMKQLQIKLDEAAKVVTRRSGMAEEDLTAYSENPSNFSPDAWKELQDNRQLLYKSARNFSLAMDKKRAKKSTLKEKEESPVERKRKAVRAKTRRPKKSDWKRS